MASASPCRIYDFCKEGRCVEESQTIPEPPAHLIDSTSIELAYAPNVSTNRYRGLTQTCKLLREDFRAGYMAVTTVLFDWPESFTLYIDAFYPSSSAQEKQDHHRRFLLDMRDDNFELDILPILKSLIGRPHIRCAIFCPRHTGSAVVQINALFRHTVTHHNND